MAGSSRSGGRKSSTRGSASGYCGSGAWCVSPIARGRRWCRALGRCSSPPRPFGETGDGRPFLVLILRDTDPVKLLQIVPRLAINLSRLGERHEEHAA